MKTSKACTGEEVSKPCVPTHRKLSSNKNQTEVTWGVAGGGGGQAMCKMQEGIQEGPGVWPLHVYPMDPLEASQQISRRALSFFKKEKKVYLIVPVVIKFL